MKQTLAIIVFYFLCTLAHSLYNDERNPALDERWFIYKSTLNKRHTDSMDNMRRTVWESNLKYIEKHNLEADLRKHSYHLGMNEFGDLTHEEFKAQTFSSIGSIMNASNTIRNERNSNISTNIPEHVDWQRNGCVAPVKSQKFCGSCGQMAAVGGFESAFCIKTKRLISFSVQQMINCAPGSCHGSSILSVLNFIKHKGIQPTSLFPYVGRDRTCVYSLNDTVAHLRKVHAISNKNRTYDEQVRHMTNAIANVGPLIAYMDATQLSFSYYKYGIYQPDTCHQKEHNHGVVIIGYGSNYWKIKNSWGSRWGRGGYAYISKGTNMCGIEHAMYSVII